MATELNLTALDDSALGQRVAENTFNVKAGDKIPMRDNCPNCGDTRYALIVPNFLDGVWKEGTPKLRVGAPAFHTHDPKQLHGHSACISYLSHRLVMGKMEDAHQADPNRQYTDPTHPDYAPRQIFSLKALAIPLLNFDAVFERFQQSVETMLTERRTSAMRQRFEEAYELDSGYKPCWRSDRYIHKDQADAWLGWQLAHRQVDFGLIDITPILSPTTYHLNGLVREAIKQTVDPEREAHVGKRSFYDYHRTLRLTIPRGMGATEWTLQLAEAFNMTVVLMVNPGLFRETRRKCEGKTNVHVCTYTHDWEKDLPTRLAVNLLVLDRPNFTSKVQNTVYAEIQQCWGRSLEGDLMIVIK